MTVEANPTTALVPRQAPNNDPHSLSAYEPRNLDEALRIAACYASSNLLGEVSTPEAAFMIMATGADYGIPATAALRAIHIIKGKTVLSSDLLVALCLKSDVCEYFACTESTEMSATYETKRHGRQEPVRNTFTMDDARRAKLSVADPNSNWGKYPKAMLRHRAAAELARQVYPDVVLGLYSDAEEEDIRGEVDVTPRSSRSSEPLEKAIERWKAEIAAAQTTSKCDAIGREIKARLVDGFLVKDSKEHIALQILCRARIQELRTAHQRPTRDGEIVVEREPGCDDGDEAKP